MGQHFNDSGDPSSFHPSVNRMVVFILKLAVSPGVGHIATRGRASLARKVKWLLGGQPLAYALNLMLHF